MITALIGYIEESEHTHATRKLRRQIYNNVLSLKHTNPDKYYRLSKEVHDIWEDVKLVLNDKHFTISMPAAVRSMYHLLLKIDNFKKAMSKKKAWFTKTTMEKALASMIGSSKVPDTFDVEYDSDTLIGMFAERLGISIKPTKGLAMIVAQEKARKALKEKEKEMINEY